MFVLAVFFLSAFVSVSAVASAFTCPGQYNGFYGPGVYCDTKNALWMCEYPGQNPLSSLATCTNGCVAVQPRQGNNWMWSGATQYLGATAPGMQYLGHAGAVHGKCAKQQCNKGTEKHEVFVECIPRECYESTCSSPIISPACFDSNSCVDSGCRCEAGYVRDQNRKCVKASACKTPPVHCPSFMNGFVPQQQLYCLGTDLRLCHWPNTKTPQVVQYCPFGCEITTPGFNDQCVESPMGQMTQHFGFNL